MRACVGATCVCSLESACERSLKTPFMKLFAISLWPFWQDDIHHGVVKARCHARAEGNGRTCARGGRFLRADKILVRRGSRGSKINGMVLPVSTDAAPTPRAARTRRRDGVRLVQVS